MNEILAVTYSDSNFFFPDLDEIDLPQDEIVDIELESSRNTDQDKIISQIMGLRSLKEGWDFGEGAEFTPEVISKAIKLYRDLAVFNLSCKMHPVSDGAITLVFSAFEVFLDVTIENDLTLSLVKERGIGYDFETLFEYDNVSKLKLMEEISILATDKYVRCSLSEPLISVSTTPKKADFKATASRLTGMAFPFFVKNARSMRHQMGFVSI